MGIVLITKDASTAYLLGILMKIFCVIVALNVDMSAVLLTLYYNCSRDPFGPLASFLVV